MSREYAEGLRNHKLAVFRDFQRMIPSWKKASRTTPSWSGPTRRRATMSTDGLQRNAVA